MNMHAKVQKENPTLNRKIKCIDVFAGAGGFSKAALDSGQKVIMAVEFDNHAAETYKSNLINGPKSIELYKEDITTLCPKKLYEKHFPEEDCDLLLGGPPCQGFSSHRIKDSGVDDPRNQLILKYFEFVKAFQPKAFLLENVPGMLWPRHKNYVDSFYAQAADAGYNVFKPVIMDARDYGLPQRRKRVFILGVRPDIDTTSFEWPITPTHGSEVARRKNSTLKEWVDCSAAFKKVASGDINDLHMNHTQAIIEVFKKTPPNGGSRTDSGRVLPCHKNYPGHKDVYGRIDSKQPAPTMTASCTNPSKGRFVHPTKHHGITVRQAARIQTFPDDYVFHGGLTAAGKQIGNAVPVELGKILIKHIAELIKK